MRIPKTIHEILLNLSTTDGGSIDATTLGSSRVMDVPYPAAASPRLVVAVGPEGGWTDSELELFLSRNFLPVHMGERVLRTDVATCALLALAHEWVSASPNQI